MDSQGDGKNGRGKEMTTRTEGDNSMMDREIAVVPANPGFELLTIEKYNDSFDFEDIVRQPIIAWKIVEYNSIPGHYYPEHITLRGVGNGDILAIKCPDGRVFCIDQYWESEEEWIKAEKEERK
jgi:hypothetical protein